jgi:uncharacterized protein (DUF302 family)
MSRIVIGTLIAVGFLAVLSFAPAQSGDSVDDLTMRYTTTEIPYEDVVLNLELAITGRGFVIDNRSYIGKMLRRTGKDLGLGGEVFANAQQFHFCPATYSRNMMEASPHNIAFCPYIISAYNLPDDPKTVYVAFRRPNIVGSEASQKALKAVDDLLKSLVEEALQ